MALSKKVRDDMTTSLATAARKDLNLVSTSLSAIDRYSTIFLPPVEVGIVVFDISVYLLWTVVLKKKRILRESLIL